MNREKALAALPPLLLAATAVTAVASWIGSIYGWDTRSLLSTDGIRWAVSSTMDNFAQAPVAHTLLATIALSLLTESGLLGALRSTHSLKQRRALQTAAILAAAFVLLLAALTLYPDALLLSAFGTYGGSPLQHGLHAILLLAAVVLSLTYGYMSGRLLTFADMARAAAHLPARIAAYWPTLFLAAQLVAALGYACPPHADGTAPRPLWLEVLARLLYNVPLLLHIVLAYRCDRSA